MIARFEANRGDILTAWSDYGDAFDGNDPLRIKRFKIMNNDPHHKGGRVIFIYVQDKKIVYKPSSVDANFVLAGSNNPHSFFTYVNRWIKEGDMLVESNVMRQQLFMSYPVISASDDDEHSKYGFIYFLAHYDMRETRDEMPRGDIPKELDRRGFISTSFMAGQLLAIMTLFRVHDLHVENLMALVPLDVETMFTPDPEFTPYSTIVCRMYSGSFCPTDIMRNAAAKFDENGNYVADSLKHDPNAVIRYRGYVGYPPDNGLVKTGFADMFDLLVAKKNEVLNWFDQRVPANSVVRIVPLGTPIMKAITKGYHLKLLEERDKGTQNPEKVALLQMCSSWFKQNARRCSSDDYKCRQHLAMFGGSDAACDVLYKEFLSSLDIPAFYYQWNSKSLHLPQLDQKAVSEHVNGLIEELEDGPNKDVATTAFGSMDSDHDEVLTKTLKQVQIDFVRAFLVKKDAEACTSARSLEERLEACMKDLYSSGLFEVTRQPFVVATENNAKMTTQSRVKDVLARRGRKGTQNRSKGRSQSAASPASIRGSTSTGKNGSFLSARRSKVRRASRRGQSVESLQSTVLQLKDKINRMEEETRMLRAQGKRMETEIQRSDKQLSEMLDNLGGKKGTPLVHTVAEMRRLRALVKQLRNDVRGRDTQISSLLSSHRHSQVSELEVLSEEYLREISRLQSELKKEADWKKRHRGEAQTAIEASFKVISEVKALKAVKVRLENRVAELEADVHKTREKQFDPDSGLSFESMLAEAREREKQLKISLAQSEREIERVRTHLDYYIISSKAGAIESHGRPSSAAKAKIDPASIPDIETQIENAEKTLTALRAKKRRKEEEKRYKRRLRAKELRDSMKSRQAALALQRKREAEHKRKNADERRRRNVEEKRQRLLRLQKEKEKWTRRKMRQGGGRKERRDKAEAKRWAAEQFRMKRKAREERIRIRHHQRVREEIAKTKDTRSKARRGEKSIVSPLKDIVTTTTTTIASVAPSSEVTVRGEDFDDFFSALSVDDDPTTRLVEPVAPTSKASDGQDLTPASPKRKLATQSVEKHSPTISTMHVGGSVDADLPAASSDDSTPEANNVFLTDEVAPVQDTDDERSDTHEYASTLNEVRSANASIEIKTDVSTERHVHFSLDATDKEEGATVVGTKEECAPDAMCNGATIDDEIGTPSDDVAKDGDDDNVANDYDDDDYEDDDEYGDEDFED
eukprot:g2382.t1